MPRVRRTLFKGTYEYERFYDRKILKYGHSRVMAVSRVVPKDWDLVRIYPLEKGADYVIVGIRVLVRKNDSSTD